MKTFRRLHAWESYTTYDDTLRIMCIVCYSIVTQSLRFMLATRQHVVLILAINSRIINILHYSLVYITRLNVIISAGGILSVQFSEIKLYYDKMHALTLRFTVFIFSQLYAAIYADRR